MSARGKTGAVATGKAVPPGMEVTLDAGSEGGAVMALPPDLVITLSGGGEWIGIGSIDAIQDSIYTFMVGPTPADSNQVGINWTYVRISAHTANPFVYAMSEVDSGYSLDNIAPGVPANLVVSPLADVLEISWNYDITATEDFQYFAIYRGGEAAFEPVHPDSTYSVTADTFFVDEQVERDVDYYYRVAAVDHNGNHSERTLAVQGRLVSLALDERSGVPGTFALHQNYPNPFNPSTTIRFDVPVATDIRIVMYDLLGREVVRLMDGRREPGYHSVVWNGRDRTGRYVPTGIYIARLMTPGYTKSIKTVLMK
ncbi:MAG: T9SS type A sorting domain-containing protein [Candidatus Marinimicrobia bacterium]|nr:T9SS type A sorting domain-containing protein [Candidatus Neomarinimicrobiota bacterium]